MAAPSIPQNCLFYLDLHKLLNLSPYILDVIYKQLLCYSFVAGANALTIFVMDTGSPLILFCFSSLIYLLLYIKKSIFNPSTGSSIQINLKVGKEGEGRCHCLWLEDSTRFETDEVWGFYIFCIEWEVRNIAQTSASLRVDIICRIKFDKSVEFSYPAPHFLFHYVSILAEKKDMSCPTLI